MPRDKAKSARSQAGGLNLSWPARRNLLLAGAAAILLSGSWVGGASAQTSDLPEGLPSARPESIPAAPVAETPAAPSLAQPVVAQPTGPVMAPASPSAAPVAELGGDAAAKTAAKIAAELAAQEAAAKAAKEEVAKAPPAPAMVAPTIVAPAVAQPAASQTAPASEVLVKPAPQPAEIVAPAAAAPAPTLAPMTAQAVQPIAEPPAAAEVADPKAASAAALADTIRKAIATNPRIGIVAANREAIEEELRQARGLYLPQVDGAAGIGYERTNDSRTRARLNGTTGTGVFAEDAGSRAMRRQESSLNLVQRVFTGFETESEIKRQKMRIESAANRVYENAEVLGLDAIDAYLAVARQRELLQIAEDNLRVHEETALSLRQAAAGGAASSADVTQAETRVARAKASLYQTQNDLRDAEALYINIVGEAPGDTARPAVPRDTVPVDLEAALENAAKNNPTVAIFGSDVKVAAAEIKLAEARFYPQVNIEGEAAYNDGRDGVETWERDSQIMLRTRWNLYRGGIDVANRREAVAREAEAKNRLYNAHIDAQEQMRRSWNALIASQDRTQALSEGARFAGQTRDAYRQQFRVAQRSLLDVLDAENEYFVTRGQLISAEYNEILSTYRIMAVAGTLLKTLGVEAPKTADPAAPSFMQQMIR